MLNYIKYAKLDKVYIRSTNIHFLCKSKLILANELWYSLKITFYLKALRSTFIMDKKNGMYHYYKLIPTATTKTFSHQLEREIINQGS